MKEYHSASSFSNTRNSVVTIGTFDGVHVGHKAILDNLITTAKGADLDSVVLTFYPHPRLVLQKDAEIKLLNTISEKKELIKKIGIDHLVLHPFTTEFSRLTAMEYVRDILVNQLKAKKIIIGYDHRFGRNRTATIDDLREFGRTYEFEVEEINAQEINQVTISSTKIRKALDAGEIDVANNYLGYPYMITGQVVKGKGIGRTLAFPTANLKIEESNKLIPRNGVYIVFSEINNKIVYGITSIGTNPTVGGTEKTIETFFLDYKGDLYDRPLRIEFITFIREEKIFTGTDELKIAIEEDEIFARNYIRSLA